MLFNFWRRHYGGEDEEAERLPSGPQPVLSPLASARLAAIFPGFGRA